MWTPSDDRLYCVDRIESDVYVLTDANGHETAARGLPPQARPGDSVHFVNGTWTLCPEETNARKYRIKQLLNKVIRKNK